MGTPTDTATDNLVSIPAIMPYPMPTESELPANRASWRPDPRRAALLIHDMQRYFVDFFPSGEPVTTLVANTATLRAQATELGMPVIYTAQPGAMTRHQRGLLHDIWGPGMSADPYGRQIIDELAPTGRDVVLTKWRYSAFNRSNLTEILGDHGRDQLIICGVYAHVGVLMTALDAFSMDIEPFLAADAVADFTAREHQMALGYAAGRCAVTLTTDRLVATLRRADPAMSIH